MTGRVLLVVGAEEPVKKQQATEKSETRIEGGEGKDVGATSTSGGNPTDGTISAAKEQLPTPVLLAVLGAIRTLLDNCQNKHIFNSIEVRV